MSAIRIDATAAAYGLIQVLFADATEHLAGAVFWLQHERDPSVSFEFVFRGRFTDLLRDFRRELTRFDAEDFLAVQLNELRHVCDELDCLSRWRNERIHARVRRVAEGLALYHPKTGVCLSISEAECSDIINRLVGVITSLEGNLPDLLHDLEVRKHLDEMLDALLNALEEPIEPQ